MTNRVPWSLCVVDRIEMGQVLNDDFGENLTVNFMMRKIAVFSFTVLCGKKALLLLQFGPVYTFKSERESEIFPLIFAADQFENIK